MSTQPPPEVFFAALHAQTGGRLFTVTVLDRAEDLARRLYTSHPETYPVSGTKPISQDDWTVQVIENGELFVANTVAEFSKYFADHAVIESLGCQSALNIPITEGQIIGTVNILDREHYFTPQAVAHCTDTCKQHHEKLVQALRSYKF